MKTRNLYGIVCGSVVLAACGGGGGGGSASPASVTVPSWVTIGTPNPALSSNQTETSSDTVEITFNADGSILFDLGSGNLVSVTNDEIEFNSSGPDGELFFFVANDTGTDADFVELVILDDPTEADIAALARIDQIGTGLGYETNAVIGNTTSVSSLPTGSAEVYLGYMIGSLLVNGELPDFNGDSDLDLQYDFVGAAATVDVDFTAVTDEVGVTFSDFFVPNPAGGPDISLGASEMIGTASITDTTSIYVGTISGNLEAGGNTYVLSGDLNGGFFGANGQATAGTFTTDDTNPTPTGAEFLGNFAAN